eukprot:15464703-Alexandrium_andersonii.AAC.1
MQLIGVASPPRVGWSGVIDITEAQTAAVGVDMDSRIQPMSGSRIWGFSFWGFSRVIHGFTGFVFSWISGSPSAYNR